LTGIYCLASAYAYSTVDRPFGPRAHLGQRQGGIKLNRERNVIYLGGHL
jgi:hypothetical protein